MRKYFLLVSSLSIALACVIPGLAPSAAPLPTFDPNSVGTSIAETAAVARTQTAQKVPTATRTPTPTYTPSITPTFTPTFIFMLPTLTPIPTFTVPPTVGTIQTPGGGSGSGGDDEATPTKNKDEDPRKPSGKEWSCVWYGVTPPRYTVFKPQARFTVQWNIYNSGTKSWPRTGVDFVYRSGYRHEETKIQDFHLSIPPGGEIKVSASFIAPKRAGDYQTFFYLMVGKRQFCPVAYYFTVEE